MNIASDYLARARVSLGESRRAFEQEDWALSIARSAETVEFAVKALIRAVGQIPRPVHDVSGDLTEQENFMKFPPWFQERVPRFSLVSRVLSEVYIKARYGHEALGAPPTVLFVGIEAQAYLSAAEEILEACATVVADR